jgi:hypothetical protein
MEGAGITTVVDTDAAGGRAHTDLEIVDNRQRLQAALTYVD